MSVFSRLFFQRYYMGEEEVDFIIRAVEFVATNGWKLLPKFVSRVRVAVTLCCHLMHFHLTLSFALLGTASPTAVEKMPTQTNLSRGSSFRAPTAV